MKIRTAGLKEDSVVDGTGIRLVLFTQGCPHGCKGCHNPQTHSMTGGTETDTAEVIEIFERNSLLDGITFSGGEPFMQPKPLSLIADWLHEHKLNVWCYSGYTLEELTEKGKTDANISDLLSKIDVLIDGRFREDLLDLRLRFRGSKNQRVIDLNKTRKSGKVELLFDDTEHID